MDKTQTTNQVHNAEVCTTADISFNPDPVNIGKTTYMTPGPSDTLKRHMAPPQHHKVPPSRPIDLPSMPQAVITQNFTNGSSAAAYTDQLYSSSFGTPLLTLEGVFGVRFTLCYRLEIATNPQVSGVIQLAWHPFTSSPSLRTVSRSVQALHAEINLAEGSSCELRIPWFHYKEFIERMNPGSESFGALQVNPYIPVAWDTASVSTPSFTLYRWLEDIECYGNSTAVVTATPQSGLSEEKKRGTGPVSSWLSFAGNVAKAVSSVPQLSALATPVSWALSGASSVAAYFGWSKPMNSSASMVMIRSMCRANNTALDNDFANTSGLFANNEVGVMPGFAGKDVDEMSLCYLTCIPGRIATITLSPTDVVSSSKWTCPIDPSCFFSQTSNGQRSIQSYSPRSANSYANYTFNPSPIMFASGFFKQWRGDLIFRFKFGRTKFHGGKVMIGYVPLGPYTGRAADTSVALLPDMTRKMTFPSAIVDLRTTSVFDFEVPFTHVYDWCFTNSTWNANYAAATGVTGDTGFIFMSIVDPVNAPPNCVSSVTVVVEVMAKTGLQFSVPVQPAYSPANPAVGTVIAQSHDFSADLYSVGESVQSLKMILCRPIWNLITTPGAQLSPITNTLTTPSYLEYSVLVTDPLHTTSQDWQPMTNIVNVVGCIFALWRGSHIYKAQPCKPGTLTSFAAWNTTSTLYGGNCVHAFSVEGTDPNNFRLPFYSRHNRLPTRYTLGNGQLTRDDTIVMNISNNDTGGYYLGVCAGDDFQFGLFHGVPLCCNTRFYS